MTKIAKPAAPYQQSPPALRRAIDSEFLRVSRRGFIRKGVWFGLGIIASGTAGLSYLRRSPRDALSAPEGLQVLSASQYQLFQRLGEICFPVSGSTLASVAELPIGLIVDGLVADVRADVRKSLLIGLDLIDNAAVITGGHGCRLVDMPEAAACAYLDQWTNSAVPAFRAIANAATRLTKTAYWSNASAWAAIDFPGPVTRPRGIERLGNAPSPAVST